MVTHPSILAWRIPRTEDPGRHCPWVAKNGLLVGIWNDTVQFSHSVMYESLWPHGLQHAQLPCPLQTLGACSNSCPSSQWCHPTISSSVIPFSSCLQSFLASASFPMSQFFTSGAAMMKCPIQFSSKLKKNNTIWYNQTSDNILKKQSLWDMCMPIYTAHSSS